MGIIVYNILCLKMFADNIIRTIMSSALRVRPCTPLLVIIKIIIIRELVHFFNQMIYEGFNDLKINIFGAWAFF